MTEDSKLVEPLSTVVSAVLRLLIGLLALGFVLSLFKSNVHFFGWDSANTCVSADWISVTTTGMDAAFNTKAGAHTSTIPHYCTEHPSTYQNTLTVLGSLPSFLLTAVGLLVLNRLLREAARKGVYTQRTASQLKLLGWLLLLGSLLTRLVEANAEAALLATLTDAVTFDAGTWLHLWTMPYFPILAALGLLTFARIVRAGTAMREDLDGTV
ncbi:DUF2975 domain-containing protein [Streptomyces sp. CA-251251]|uniref:DUF2975 domain-containing protein n=1 Tax=Streptomyces sp. CA-251251 TaxID=3240063 RepID=UPI003D8A15C5